MDAEKITARSFRALFEHPHSHANGHANMYMDPPVSLRYKMPFRHAVDQSMRKAQGQVHPFTLSEIISGRKVDQHL